MSTIKRGVSSYSYQNLIFDRKMDWKGFIRTVREDLDTDGIEIVDETFLDDYPFVTDRFVFDWNNEMAKYGMKAVTMDIYLDVLQFRDHVMSHKEAAERMKRDLIIASRLGFENVRCLATIPTDVIEMSLETAEKYNVRIGKEVHAPIQINYDEATNRNPKGVVEADFVDRTIDLIQETGTKHLGFVPDMGLFQSGYTPSMVEQAKRTVGADLVEKILEMKKECPPSEIQAWIRKERPDVNLFSIGRLIQPQASAETYELLKVIPYTVSIHGKFYEMIDDPADPGHYYDPSIPYDEIFKYLKMGHYNGYIDSEFEGQGNRNDLPDEEMFDEREQVRRQHLMMKDLGAV